MQSGSGKTLADVRNDGWLPDESAWGIFYEQWTHLDWSKISVEAVIATLPETAVLAVMVTLDAFLYLKMTKSELQTKMDMENELSREHLPEYAVDSLHWFSWILAGKV